MRRLSLIVAFVLSLQALPGAAATTTPEIQRQRFLAARTALERGDARQFDSLSAQLHDYPLYPYLLYWEMERAPALDAERVHRFLNDFADAPLAASLRERWLHQLAGSERWQNYLADYQPSRKSELRCNYHYGQFKTGNADAAWAGAKELWLNGSRQDSACNRLFLAWQEAGKLSDSLRRQRLALALQAGNMDLAISIAASLTETDRRRVKQWQQVRNQPASVTTDRAFAADTVDNRELVSYGVQRLSRSDPQGAANAWKKLAGRYDFTTTQRNAVLNELALRVALSGDISALDWLAQIPADAQAPDTRQWAVRVALRNERWQNALAIMQSMPPGEQREEEWQYWTARCLEALDKPVLAQPFYYIVAGNRSYYGFLAADHLDVGYNLNHQPLNVDNAALNELLQIPALLRAYELLQLGLTKEARSEWEQATARMSYNQRIAAGKLASEWYWHDRAALTLTKAGYYDDLEIRFPLAYSNTVFKEADANTLDPAWVFAVARQESVMMPDARSPVGALGLMQLMPTTGKRIARQLKSGIDDLRELLAPETNIRFGTFYLRQLSEQFDNNKVLATAAYNAGPHRVNKWTPEQGTMAADLWVDTIPFGETRQYVRRVLAYSVFYDQRLNRDIVRLRDRMPLIQQ